MLNEIKILSDELSGDLEKSLSFSAHGNFWDKCYCRQVPQCIQLHRPDRGQCKYSLLPKEIGYCKITIAIKSAVPNLGSVYDIAPHMDIDNT